MNVFRIALIIAMLFASTPLSAETLLAARNIRAGAVIIASDIVPPKSNMALRTASSMIGMEASRNLYIGKPIHKSDLQAPRLIERNAIISIIYAKGPLSIETEGRALEDGARGARIRVMNLKSKRIVTATVTGTNLARSN